MPHPNESKFFVEFVEVGPTSRMVYRREICVYATSFAEAETLASTHLGTGEQIHKITTDY